MLSNLSQQMYRYRLEYVKDDEHYDRLIEEHNIIFDAISRRDSKVGAEAIISHIDNQEKSIMRSIAARRRK